MTPVRVSHFSDVLCFWAYAAQRRLDELAKTFGEDIVIDTRYCSIFPDAWGKIEKNWKDKGGFSGFNQHLIEAQKNFPHVDVNERLWLETRPCTSASGHMFLKAVELVERDSCLGDPIQKSYLEQLVPRAAWALRCAFFVEAKDISDWRVHREVSQSLGIDYAQVEEKIRSSQAVAQLAIDYSLSQEYGVEGSPTFIMNDGRQKLFGNVGYRLLEANVQELLRPSTGDEASWC